MNNSGNLSGTGAPFAEGGTDPGGYATYDGDSGINGLGSPYYRTEVGEWENSASPYGTFDQGGNHREWIEDIGGVGIADMGMYEMYEYEGHFLWSNSVPIRFAKWP